MQVYSLPGGITTATICPYCRTPIVPRTKDQVTCGKPACRSQRNCALKAERYRADPAFAEKAKERWRLWHDKPENAERCRTRNRVRMARVRGSSPRPEPAPSPAAIDPWTLAAPAYDPHLPGGLLELGFDPTSHRPMPQEHLRALHGLLSTLRGKDHSRTHADVALLAWACRSGWATYLHDREEARALAGQRIDGRLYDRPVTLVCGPLMKLRAPVVPPGRCRLRLDAVTPVVIRASQASGAIVVRTSPTAHSLRSSLLGLAEMRLGLRGITPEQVPIVVTGQATEKRGVEVGGHWGHITDGHGGYVQGWVGQVTLETNAIGRWLLECAGKIGLGGRTALGFGRVVVKEAT